MSAGHRQSGHRIRGLAADSKTRRRKDTFRRCRYLEAEWQIASAQPIPLAGGKPPGRFFGNCREE